MHILSADKHIAGVKPGTKICNQGERGGGRVKGDFPPGGTETGINCGDTLEDILCQLHPAFEGGIHFPVARNERCSVYRFSHGVKSCVSREKKSPGRFDRGRNPATPGTPQMLNSAHQMSASGRRETAYSICARHECQRHNAFGRLLNSRWKHPHLSEYWIWRCI